MVRVRNGIVKQSEEKTLGNCLLNPKELLRLRNLIGPTALGFIAAWEAGEITTDHLRKGIPWNEAFAKNWLTKSFLPYSEEFAKQKNVDYIFIEYNLETITMYKIYII